MPSRSLWPCAVLLVTGALCLLAGGIALYGQHTVIDERAFADRATSTLSQAEVGDEIVTRITGRMVQAHPELAPKRPAIQAAAQDIVDSPRFAPEFHRGAVAMHRELFTSSRQTVRLVMPGAGADMHSRDLPAIDPELLALGGGPLETRLRDAAPAARSLARLAPLALALGAFLLVLAVLRAPTRRRGVRRAALAVAAVGAITVAALTLARALLLSTFDSSRGDTVVRTIWNAYLGDLRLWGFACAGIALAFARAAEASRLRLIRSPAD
jgi:hypothetical protein